MTRTSSSSCDVCCRSFIIMTLVRLKKFPFPYRVESFNARPSWVELASRITKIFDIPLEKVGVAYMDDDETSVITDETALLDYYNSIPETLKIKFVVINVGDRDSEFACSSYVSPPFLNPHSAATTISASWSSKSNLQDLAGKRSSISSLDHSIS